MTLRLTVYRQGVPPTALALWLVLSAMSLPLAAQEENDTRETPFLTHGIVARVNQEIVTSDEVEERLQAPLEGLRHLDRESFVRKARELYDRTLREIIEERVVLQAARKAGVMVPEESVDKEVEKEVKRAGGRDVLDKLLRQRGSTWTRWRDDVRKELITRELILRRLGFAKMAGPDDRMPLDSIPSPAMLRKYYDAHQEEFCLPEQVRSRQIVIGYGPRERSLAWELVQSLRRQLLEMADFATLARLYSDDRPEEGGDWGWCAREVFEEDAAERIFALKVGELSEPIESSGSFRLVLVEERKAEERKSFDHPDVQRQISDIVQNRLVTENIARIRRELVQEAFVEILGEE